MIKISEVVSKLLEDDDLALESLRANILNLSAYANKIKPKVEKTLYKNVRKGSIVTALSRISEKMSAISPLKVDVRIEDMSIKTPLCEITYEKTEDICKKVSELATKYAKQGFFASTYGVSEVTLVVSEKIKPVVLKSIKAKTKGIYDNLSAITTRFIEEDYIEVPNMIYTLVSAFAGKRVNLIEIISTFSEISFIVREGNLKESVDILKDNFLN